MITRDQRKILIGVLGASHTDHCGLHALDDAKALGREIASRGAVLVTSATSGIGLWAAMGALESGGFVIGLSPERDEAEHVARDLPVEFMSVLLYTGLGDTARDLLLSRMTDGVVVGCGGIESIREVSIAFEESPLVAILDEGETTPDAILTYSHGLDRQIQDKIFSKKTIPELVEHLFSRINKKTS